MRAFHTVLGFVCLVIGLTPAVSRAEECPRRRVLSAVGEALFVNLTVNRLDAWARNQPWAYVDPASWARNLRLGWTWDEDHFFTNMFSHPYHGGLYFNSGRDNCLGYWGAAPIAFLGSWTWEYLGERFRPSLNDFYMTSIGGIALGEVTHRLGATIRNTKATGSSRLFRELAALVVDPIGGINGLIRGEWGQVRDNPPEHDPGAFMFRFNAGVRWIADSNDFSSPVGSPTIIAEMNYGDPFERPSWAPFDVFNVRAQVSPGGGGLNLLRASGRLYQTSLNKSARRNRHVFMVSQRYDFVNNPAYKFGGQSIETSIQSRWRLGRGSTHLRTKFGADGILLGAIDAPYSGVGDRTYDFGPGVGLIAALTLERRQTVYLEWYNRIEYLHSVSGAAADHGIAFTGLEGLLPLRHGIGLGLCLSAYARSSTYSDKPVEQREFPELRVFLTLITSHQPGGMLQP